jgi:hypothetical protein
VREVALRSAQVLVATQGKRHSSLILPSLLSGMSDDEWRIRQNSVMLLGELLYLIADTKAIGLVDHENEDDDAGIGGGGNISRVIMTIRAILTDEVTNKVLASLYVARSDVGSTVRQAALQVWKSVVSNTPRTLVEIMGDLVDLVVNKLSVDNSDQQTIAARCLSDLVKKLGDRVLPIVVPHLSTGLSSLDIAVRRGVCVGLSEILSAATKVQIDQYLDTLVPALHIALCDETSPEVRTQGALAFQTLVKTIGPSAVSNVVPSLLQQFKFLMNEDSIDLQNCGPLLGLGELVACKPREVLEYLLPVLFSSPMTKLHAIVLKTIAPVVREYFN